MYTSLLVLLPLIAASLTGAKHHQVHDEFAAYVDWVRGKRQSHPDITVAKIPQIPFEPIRDSVEDVPVPLEYLTPPFLETSATTLQTTGPPVATQPITASASPAAVTSITAPSASAQTTKWELGFDANDILVPPVVKEQNSEYDTLKLFAASSLRPEISLQRQAELLLDSFGPSPSEQDAAANRPPERFAINNFNPNSDFTPSADDISKPPVYSFVKTNPHGHFKWGVHIGGR